MGGLTEAQRAKMSHALGLDRREEPYRNYYCASVGTADDAIWLELVGLGLARQVSSHVNGWSNYYDVTEAGRRTLSGYTP